METIELGGRSGREVYEAVSYTHLVRMRAALRGHQALRLGFPPERGPARAASGTRSARRPP